jgi:glycosyltransferase involved in cell wall biosynthesis/SAM-dependent methyltransferase
MQMTFAELAQASPAGFSSVAWPCRGEHSIDDLAGELIRVADALAHSVNGPLVGVTLGVVSSHPEHVILARLLACHGASVSFFCPHPVVWDDHYGSLCRALVSILERYHEQLNHAPLSRVTVDNFTEGPDFALEPQWPVKAENLPAKQYDRLFVYDLLGETPEGVEERLVQFGALLRSGGSLELFGPERGPATQAVLGQVLEQANSVGFGGQAAGSSPRGDWRLNLQWMGKSVREYPSDLDHAQLLAHCEARLHFGSHFVSGADVLEAGCGSGRGARMFLAAGAASVVGLDYSDEALAVARKHGADPRIEYRQWDLNQTPLPLPDNRFDVVVCLEVLEHIYEQRALIAEFLRVLRPGGRLVLSVPDRAFEEEFVTFNSHRNTFHVSVPSRAEFEQLLTGFTQLRFARQIDFVASCVLEDEGGALSGDWCEQSPGPEKNTVETIFAVGIKPPASLAQSVGPYRPHLRVFENALSTHVGWRRWSLTLERELAKEKLQSWADRNRYEPLVRRRMMQGPMGDPDWLGVCMQAWVRCGIEAYSVQEIMPGNWISRFEEVYRSRGKSSMRTAFPQPLHWEMIQTNAGPLLQTGMANPGGVSTVLFPCPEGHVGIRALWRWKRRGAKTIWFYESEGWKQYDLLGYLAWRTTQWLGRRALPWVASLKNTNVPTGGARVMLGAMRLGGISRPAMVSYAEPGTSCRAAWLEWLADAEGSLPQKQPAGRPLKTIHCIGALNAGGAERQLCNLAQGQKRRGIDVRVLTMCELENDLAHYSGLLAEEKVPVRQAGRPYVSPAIHRSVPWSFLRSVPASIQYSVVNLLYELLADRPDVLHCWLDQPNVAGAIAGLMAGVPHIILSTRNSNPTNFPRILEDYFQEWYQLAARSRRVHFIANSHSGAASYAEWLDLPVERFHVVFNGICFDHFPKPTAELRQQARQSFGLSAEDRVVCGVFRLAAEKQPELFLDVLRRVHARVPHLQVVLAGVGDLEERARQVIRATGMEHYVRLLGRRSDIGTIFMASDASLLTSTLEGCPNAALESQYLGVPIVATSGGGTIDAVQHGVTGFLAGIHDAEGLAGALTHLLLDEVLRQRLSAAGPEFVRRRFALEPMVDQTMAVYETAQVPSPSSRRILPLEPELVSRVA